MAKQTHLTVINLDRPRIMRFDLDELVMLEELTGAKTVEELLQVLNSFSGLRKAAFCALSFDAKENGETLTLDNVGDILRHAEYVDDIVDKVVEAFTNSFRAYEKERAEQADEAPKN